MAAFTGICRENSEKGEALRQISKGVRISKGVFESAMVNQQGCLNQQCYLRAQREDKKDTDSTENDIRGIRYLKNTALSIQRGAKKSTLREMGGD